MKYEMQFYIKLNKFHFCDINLIEVKPKNHNKRIKNKLVRINNMV